ncbi:MAG: hypothetical protein IPG10_15990 [Flavobacteriales bacterium]|nr:hypothetical protein [Flavobacteriales bacterium]MBK6752333.1 hypothetical protein [Flavobacteriales bacterium]MBK7268903.1 hypothetical protein [Flavobacteriales bacterium]MBK9074305.1 hypothetical protein [Flavobacteriales bacterium]MBP6389393.1 hypothetical protein [Flavobacteriales bacterium]
MNTNWSKILLFSLLSFALGFVICCLCCRMCGGGSCHRGGCGNEMSCGQGAAACAHGSEGKGSCCKGGHGAAACAHGGEGMGACCKGGHGGKDHGVHAIVKGLEGSDFQGDTTISIPGGTVNVNRVGDKMEVKVEMQDSTGKEMSLEIEEKN